MLGSFIDFKVVLNRLAVFDLVVASFFVDLVQTKLGLDVLGPFLIGGGSFFLAL